MPKPAARSTDHPVHGGSITSGSPTVKVNELDAARLSDPHACPLTDPINHVGGVIQLGEGAALTVLINRKPAIALDGQAACAAATPNPIHTASGNVYYTPTDTIAGLKVTQDADGTIHIGTHISIPPAGQRNIHANGVTTTINDDDYGAHVLADIAKIGSTDVGAQRLQNLDASGHNVTIVPNRGDSKNAYSSPKNQAGAKTPGTGSDVEIQYTPEEWPPDKRAESTTTGAEGDVILFHEMNHAEHQAYGREASTVTEPIAGDYDTLEEQSAIEGDENVYRRKRGFPERHHHHHN